MSDPTSAAAPVFIGLFSVPKGKNVEKELVS
jgi:hypothetical protein